MENNRLKIWVIEEIVFVIFLFLSEVYGMCVFWNCLDNFLCVYFEWLWCMLFVSIL